MVLYPNAKINIGLNITSKRSDGYHNIQTIFYPLALHDQLAISIGQSDSRYSVCNFKSEGIVLDVNTGDNLVEKAYKLLDEIYTLPSVNVELIKNIPIGAGLGGGSSDAAFMLVALRDLFQLNIDDDDLEIFAAKLGADCPFFIKNKPIYATGIGNVFSPVDITLNNYHIMLVKPSIHVSTAEAYSGVKPQETDLYLPNLVKMPVDEWKHNIFNDFEKGVFIQYPEIKLIKELLYDSGALYASMSGSGSSVFGLYRDSPPELKEFRNYFVFNSQI